MTLTYRANRTSTLLAAYAGACRVGYVERTTFARYRWQLSLVQSSGNYAYGVEDNEDDARERLQAALCYWLDCAGLQPKETTHVATKSAHPAVS